MSHPDILQCSNWHSCQCVDCISAHFRSHSLKDVLVSDFVQIEGAMRRLALNLHAESLTRSKDGELREENVVTVELKHESEASRWSNDDPVIVTLLKL